MTKPFIIAEIGINHNGNMDIAKKLIDIAADAGCNAVKFQKRTIDEVYTQEYLSDTRNSPWGTTQREQKEGLEFEKAEYNENRNHPRSSLRTKGGFPRMSSQLAKRIISFGQPRTIAHRVDCNR